MFAVLFFCIGVSAACSSFINTGRRAICVVQPNPGSDQKVTGTVVFNQESYLDQIKIDVKLSGFKYLPSTANDSDYLHGFHVHATGNISGGCDSAGGHFNPKGVDHGAPGDSIRHDGDFGNIRQTPQGTVETSFYDRLATLYGCYSIIGRAIVVHAKPDDLGKGGNPNSLINGNAGARLGCCVIGWA